MLTLLQLFFWTCLPSVTGVSIPGNNAPPTIVFEPRNLKIPDNEPIGARMGRAIGHDAELAPVVYGIKPGSYLDGSEYFRIDSITGDIYLNRSLEGQAGRQFYLYVTADDGVHEAKAEIFVEVMPRDGRTKPPRFPPSFTTLLPVTTPPSLTPFPVVRKPEQKFFQLPSASNAKPPPVMAYPANKPGIKHGEQLPNENYYNYQFGEQGSSEGGYPSRGVYYRSQSVNDGRSVDFGKDLTITVIPIIALIGLAPLIGLSAWFIKRRCQKKNAEEGEEEDEKKDGVNRTGEDTTPTSITTTPILHRAHSNQYEPFEPRGTERSKWEFPRIQLKMNGVVGEGCFGQVFKCEAWNIAGIEGVTTVAVKTLKDNAGERETKDLLSELEVMKSLDPHPNVVRLLGSCTEKDPIYVIMEYVPYGKLQTYLRNNRAEHYYKNLHGSSKSLTSHDLTSFSYQVAKGMAYLSSKGIIHRDLAARNILIGDNKTCKVADFGFARDIIANHVYERKSEGRLPIRWMAPESLYDNIFTMKTDVWSFGILMWEIVTLGSTPYPGMAAGEVMQRVRDGYRLEKPVHCKREFYNIMYYCWDQDAQARLSFSELSDVLEQLLISDTDYIELERFPDHMYYNIASPSSEKI